MLRSVKRDSKVSVCKVVVVLLSTYGPSALKTLRALAPDRNRGTLPLWKTSSHGQNLPSAVPRLVLPRGGLVSP